MLTKITASVLTCLFLLGNMFLPLCDFSLFNDIPRMYQSYEKVAAPDEVGIMDFVGDYLLAGKNLLGHNKNDKPANSNNRVQFQHSPTSSGFFFYQCELPDRTTNESKLQHHQTITIAETSEFHPELLRPPLV